ncbi:MAG: phosphonate ABC transporter ATP-binding protein, partial [Devosia sp.]
LDPRNAQIVMDSLKAINEQQGITVITNLHTLDTARHYCERIIGMAAGRVVFDGAPHALTEDAAREIYGADGLKEAFSEAITSTSLPGRRIAAELRPAESAFAAS